MRGYPDRYVVLAEGKKKLDQEGRFRGEVEKGVFMSCLLRPSIFPSQAALLSSLSAVALTTALSEHTSAKLGIGWVSKIYCNGRIIGDCTIEGKLDNFTSYEYIIRMQNGNLTSICKASSLAVSTLPTKTTYAVGETLDLTDMVVTLTRQDGTTEEVNNYSYTEPDMSVAGTVDVTVSYVEAGETYSATFTVTITEATTTEETETTT